MQVVENVDLLRNIVGLTLPPAFLLNPNECAVPKSRWVQAVYQRLDLMSLSKAWYLATWDGLYADICIQRIDQLPLLVRTVTSSETIASKIRSVHFFAYVPQCYTMRARKQFSKLLQACRNLYSVSFLYPYLRDYEHTPVVAWRIRSPYQITHLHIADFAQPSPKSLSTTLKNLHFQLVSLTVLPKWLHEITFLTTKGTLPSALSFPVLTHLRWDQTYFDLLTLSSHWHLPRLQHVTIHHEHINFAVFIPFFQRHGTNVTYLAFPPTRMWDTHPARRAPQLDRDDPYTLDKERAHFFAVQDAKLGPMYVAPQANRHGLSRNITILLSSPSSSSTQPNVLPSLVHLVLPPEVIIPRLPPPLNTTIRHIDIWTNSETTREGVLHKKLVDRTKLNLFRILDPTGGLIQSTNDTTASLTQGIRKIQSARFPALRSIRLISRALENLSLITSDIPPVDGFPRLALDLFIRDHNGSKHLDQHEQRDAPTDESTAPPRTTIMDCFGLQVEHGVGCIREVDFFWPDGDDEDEDPTYVPPPEDDPCWDSDEEDMGDSDEEDGDEVDDEAGSDSDLKLDFGCAVVRAEMERLTHVRF